MIKTLPNFFLKKMQHPLQGGFYWCIVLFFMFSQFSAHAQTCITPPDQDFGNYSDISYGPSVTYECVTYSGNSNVSVGIGNTTSEAITMSPVFSESAAVIIGNTEGGYAELSSSNGNNFKISSLNAEFYGHSNGSCAEIYTIIGYSDGAEVARTSNFSVTTSGTYGTGNASLSWVRENYNSDGSNSGTLSFTGIAWQDVDKIRFSPADSSPNNWLFVAMDNLDFETAISSSPGVVPTVTTTAITIFNATSATMGGTVTTDGGASVSERGIVYNTTGTPTTSDTKLQIGSGIGSFSQSVSSLTVNTTYYVRAYAVNSAGTSYGSAESFTTGGSAPTITSTPKLTAPYGNAYSYSIVATTENNLETSLSATTLPDWLTFSADGQNQATLFGSVPSGTYLSGVAGDDAGNIYAITTNGTSIYKIAADGTTTLWKSGLLSGNIYALHIANGYIYIPRYYNSTNSISRIPLNDPSATEETFATISGGALSLTDKDGWIYASEIDNYKIYKINETTKENQLILSPSNGLNVYPFGMVFGADGNLYIATWSNRTILKYDGTSVSTVLSGLPNNVSSIKQDKQGNFYLSMSGGGVRKYTTDFSSYEVVSLTATDNIWSLSFTASGALVYANFSTNEVYRLQTGAILSGTPAKSDLGTHPVVIKASNSAGYTEQSFTITVTDETKPVIVSQFPADNASDVALQPTLSITFDEEISLSTTGTFSLISGGTALKTYDLSVADDRNAFSLSEDQLTLSLPFSENLPTNTSISVEISSGFVKDAAENGNAELTAASGSWNFTTINKENQTITFNTIEGKTYGNAGFTLGDATTDKGLTVTYTAEDPTVVSISGNTATILKVGSTKITATQEGDATHTAASQVEQTLVVSAKAITVTAEAGQSKGYGQTTDPVLTYTVSPDLETGDSFSGALTRTPGEDAGTYAIALGTLTAGTNYTLTFAGDDFTIAPKAITVTAEAGQSKGYGQTDPVLTYTVSPDLETGDSFSGALTRTPGEDAGTYAITQGTLTAGTNYTLTFAGDDFTIAPKEITVTAEAGQSKGYGQTDPVLAYTVSPDLETGDSFSGALTRTPGEDAGTYAIARGTLTAGANYTLTFAGDDFTIAPKEITVTTEAGQSKGYGQTDPVLTYTVSPDLETGDSFSGALTRTPGEDAGTYPIARGTLTAGANYTLTFAGDDFTIAPKEITVTAEAGQSKGYGQTDPVLTYTVSPDLETGDSFSGALTRTPGEDAGTYAIARGTLTAGENYTLTFAGDDFTIAPKEITVTAEAGQSKGYGQTDPVLTYTVSPDLETGDSFSGALTRTPGEDAGTYPITRGTLTAGENYTLTFAGDDFTIAPKEITVTAEAGQSKGYGQTDPVLTYTVSPDLETGDSFSGALTRTPGEDAGTYPITRGTLTAGANYTLTFAGDDFTIAPKEITVTAEAGQSKGYGQTDPVLTYTVSPALETGDSFSGALTRTPGEDAGTYAITRGTLTAGENYTLTFASNDFTIGKIAQSITFDEIPLKQLETDPDFNLNATASSGLEVSYTYTFSASTAPAMVGNDGFVSLLNSGEVEITASQEGDNNYLPAEPVSRMLTIKSSDATIHELTINGTTYTNPDNEIYYLIGCGDDLQMVEVSFSNETNAGISLPQEFTVNTPVPGIYRKTIQVTSQDGVQSESYTITIEKRFSFEDIVIQKFNNVLLVNNDPASNGGYRFVAYQWYKNGKLIGTGQYYSAGDQASDQLDSGAQYTVKLTTNDGEVLETCDFNVELSNSFTLTVAPNPVPAGRMIDVVTTFTTEMLANKKITVSNLYGAPVMQETSTTNNSRITLPASLTPGTYVVTTTAGGIELSAKIIVQ